MLDINLLRNDLAGVAAALAKRGVTLDTARFDALEARAQGHPDAHAGPAGEAQRAVEADRRGKGQGRGRLRAAGRGRRPRRRDEAASKRALDNVQAKLRDFLLDLPNLTHAVHAGRQVGRRQRRGAPLGHAAHVRFAGQGSHRPRRGARAARFRDRRQALRRALLVPARRPRAAASRARAVHARHAHARARLHRVLHAVHRQRGDADRHHAAAEVRSRHVFGEEGRRAKARARRST